MIKNKDKTVKIASRESKHKFLKGLGIGLASLAAITATAGTIGALKFRSFSNDLAPIRGVNERINENGLDNEVTWINAQARVVFPKNGQFQINVKIDEKYLNDQTKRALEDTIHDYNVALKSIKNNAKNDYSLKLEYDSKKFTSLYSFDLKDDNLDDNILGLYCPKLILPTVNGFGTYKSEISVDMNKITSVDTYYSTLKDVVMHELSHGILGMGDAYNIVDFPFETIMLSSDVEPILSDLDMKNLAIKYGDGTYNSDWYKGTTWYQSMIDDSQYIKEIAFDKISEVYSYGETLDKSDFSHEYENFGFFGKNYNRLKDIGGINTCAYGVEYRNIEKNKLNAYSATATPFENTATEHASSSDAYEIGDMMFSARDSGFYVKQGNTVYSAKVSYDNGKKGVFVKPVGDILSKQDCAKVVSKWHNMVNDVKNNPNYFGDMYSNEVNKQFVTKDFGMRENLPTIQHNVIKTRYLGMYEFNGDNCYWKAREDSTDDSKLKHKEYNDLVFLSNGDVLANSSNGMVAFKFGFDNKNCNAVVNDYSVSENSNTKTTQTSSNYSGSYSGYQNMGGRSK